VEVIPAVDVLGGRVVRLVEGDYERATIFGHDPAGVVGRWIADGATRIHLVDLAGARSGVRDIGLIKAIAATGASLQVGGGIRDLAAARAALRAGAARVVVGTMAVHDPAQLGRLVTALGEMRVVAAVDVRRGMARGSGWSDEGRDADAVLADAVAVGVGSILVTGIARDGTLAGPDLELLRRARAAVPGCELIASGGIGDLDDLRQTAAAGADAVVVGRALLEGRFTLSEAAAALD
jgi:phosphoribosylformimino-5-aminoimidazole carboxamide ribotide isomerase